MRPEVSIRSLQRTDRPTLSGPLYPGNACFGGRAPTRLPTKSGLGGTGMADIHRSPAALHFAPRGPSEEVVFFGQVGAKQKAANSSVAGIAVGI
jgi:hypothetical protein